MKSTSIISLLLAVFCFALPRHSSGADLKPYLDSLLSSGPLHGASVSVMVRDLNTDSVWYAKDADRLLIPASLMKLYVSAAALDLLGPDYRFETRVSMSGRLTEKGLLRGFVCVEAGGDPVIDMKPVDSLNATVFETWVDTLKLWGVRSIRGGLFLFVKPFELEPVQEGWEVGDAGEGFAPAIDGFGFHSNVCRAMVGPGHEIGAPAVIEIDPPWAPVDIVSNIKTVSGGGECWIDYRIQFGRKTVDFQGTMPLAAAPEYLWIPVQSPAEYFGTALWKALEEDGVDIQGELIVDRMSPPAKVGSKSFTYVSPPLVEILKIVNKDSDNFTSEHMLRALGVKAYGEGETQAGLKALEDFLRSRGIDESRVLVVDGCGLSRRNLTNAEAVVRLLSVMHTDTLFNEFASTLAVAGQDGTLAHRLQNGTAPGTVQAKTGTMTHVSAVAGYAMGPRGETLAFAVLCNNFTASLRRIHKIQDDLIERLVIEINATNKMTVN